MVNNMNYRVVTAAVTEPQQQRKGSNKATSATAAEESESSRGKRQHNSSGKDRTTATTGERERATETIERDSTNNDLIQYSVMMNIC